MNNYIGASMCWRMVMTKRKNPNPRMTVSAKENFIKALSETCNVTKAAEVTGVVRWAFYKERYRDANFAEEWDQAVETAADKLVEEAWRRGVEGIDTPVVYRGKITGLYKGYSDKLLEMLLKAHRPGKFRGPDARKVGGNRGNWRVKPADKLQKFLSNVNVEEAEVGEKGELEKWGTGRWEESVKSEKDNSKT